MITHNTIVALLWLVVFAGGGLTGSGLAWWRLSYRLDECCDCCTCEDCGGIEEDQPVLFRKLGRGIGGSFDEHGEIIDQWHRDDPDRPKVYDYRRTVVLEPGPTIYPSLLPAALAGMAMDWHEAADSVERHAAAIESTWFRTVVMDWERRYPIPQDSPNGNM